MALAQKYVKYAEPNGIARTFLVPNDANYTQQWAHQVIKSEEAWNVTTGASNVVIAVIDSGVDYNHPDLAANIWNNTDEIPDNGIDDDQNGFVDDVRGWDFAEASEMYPVYPGEDGTQPDNDPMDFLGHGTVVAGIEAAVTNNEIGIAGLTWNSKIMPVKSGYATYGGGALIYDQVAAGIRYAADNGADIISMSFGGTLRSKVVYDAIKYAYDKGALLVAAVGNEGERVKTYPAAYEEVVAVTATDQYDNPAYFTNFGNWVEVAAPGVDILSTVSPNASQGPYGLKYPYDYASGTSAATPHVAGVAALIWGRFPNMTRDQVRVQLRRTAVDLPPQGFDNYYGYGRISAAEAVKQAPAEYDLLVLSWKLPFVSAPGLEATVPFYPSGGNLLGSTKYVSGSLTDLKSNNEVYMVFRSYGSSTTVTYPITNMNFTGSATGWTTTTTITSGTATFGYDSASGNPSPGSDAGSYFHKATGTTTKIADITFTTETSFSYTLGQPISVFLAYAYTLSGTSFGTGSNIIVRLVKPDATTADLDTVALPASAVAWTYKKGVSVSATNFTQSGTYKLRVVNRLVTAVKGTANYIQLNLDDVGLEITYYNAYTMEGEFTGSSNTEDWTQLVWTIDSSFTTESVTATFQLFNYTANAYPTSGDGYMTATIGTTDVITTQTITTNPKHFRDATGHWKIKVKGVKSTSSQFDWRGDLIDYKVTWPLYSVKTTVLNFGTRTVTGINVKLLVNGTEKDSERISELQSGKVANVTCSWTPVSEAIYNVTTYVEPNNELSNVTGNNAQFAYSWVRYGKAVKVPQDFPTIQEAIETTNLGIYGGEATILVSNGTYNEYDLLMQNGLTWLTLAGESTTTTISGDPGSVAVWANVENVTIKGLTITNSYIGVQSWGDNCIVSGNRITTNTYGIRLIGYYNNTIRDNIISQNSGYGINLASSSGNTIINNTSSNNKYGLYMGGVNKTLVSGNTIANNTYGIWIASSNEDVLTTNALTGNTYGFGVQGFYLSNFIHNIDTTNTVDGKPIYYLVNQSNLVIDPSNHDDVGYLGLVNSTGITVRDLTLSKNLQGVMFAFTKNSNIQNVKTLNNTYGICFYYSNNTFITKNTVTDDYYGVYIWKSINDTITQNIVSKDNYGIYLSGSSSITILGNNITKASRGINVYSSNGNVIYHNNLINNTRQVYNSLSSNSWDYGAEGNYWSDYTGLDLNGDGIGDTAYVIDANNRDRYPLKKPWAVYALNLRVMDWDLTDGIQGAYVYADSYVKISDANGWANWAEISNRNVYVKVRWHSVWVNGTFRVVVDSNKTIEIRSNVFDIVVTTLEAEQGAVLQNVNVTVYDAASDMIRTGITDSEGKVYLNNVPNSTLTFTGYDNASPQNIIANVTRTITIENQAETIVCDQNYVFTSQEWGIIADYNSLFVVLVPFYVGSVQLPVSYSVESSNILRCLRINIGLKERVKKIRSKPKNEKGERKKHESFKG